MLVGPRRVPGDRACDRGHSPRAFRLAQGWTGEVVGAKVYSEAKEGPGPQDGWTLTIEGEPSMRTHFLSLMSYERDLPMAEHVRATGRTGNRVSEPPSRG